MNFYKTTFRVLAGFYALLFAGCVGISLHNSVLVSAAKENPFLLNRQTTIQFRVSPISKGSCTLPSGIYRASFRDKDGVYYRAEKQLLVGGAVLTGGIFLPSEQQGYQKAMLWIVNVHKGVNRFPTLDSAGMEEQIVETKKNVE